MSAGKAQTESKAVFKLEGAAQIAAFDFGAGKRRHANPELDVGFDVLAGKFINEHRRERQAVVTGFLVTLPIGVGAIPVTGQTTHVALPPTLVPVELHAQSIRHGRIAGLTNCELHTCRLRSQGVPH
ncbi:hypothetical protein D3C81_1656100 [compost metagenome]